MSTSTDRPVVGPVPYLPGPLGQAITAPLPAERLAALRIGFGLLTLFDVLTQYLPFAHTLYGPAGLSSGAVGERHYVPHRGLWSVLHGLPEDAGVWLLAVWAAAAAALTVGWRPRLAAVVCWALAVSYGYANPSMHSGGDRLRTIVLLMLAFSPSGAMWSVRPAGGRAAVSGWPVRLLLFQLAVVYLVTGLHKLQHPGWQDGTAMYYVAGNPTWSTVAGAAAAVPLGAYRLLSWLTLGWQIGFPLLAWLPATRPVAIAVGMLFHFVAVFTLDVGMFSLYALFCYLPFLPWERLRASTGGGPNRGE